MWPQKMAKPPVSMGYLAFKEVKIGEMNLTNCELEGVRLARGKEPLHKHKDGRFRSGRRGEGGLGRRGFNQLEEHFPYVRAEAASFAPAECYLSP